MFGSGDDTDGSPATVVPWTDAWEFSIGDGVRPGRSTPCAFLSPRALPNELRLYMRAEGGDQPATSRVLEWRADGEPVLRSDRDRRFLIRAAWLDRRLAFAYARLRAR